jgi:hypothetical protein
MYDALDRRDDEHEQPEGAAVDDERPVRRAARNSRRSGEPD